MVESRVGENLPKMPYTLELMINEKILVEMETHCSVESLDSFSSLYYALTRQDLNQQPTHGRNQVERLSIEEAVYHYTIGIAYASIEEEVERR